MAEEMGVRFLGAVPIDVGFGEMIESGMKGKGELDAQNESKRIGDGDGVQDRNLLVERYKKCWSLSIFECFAKTLIEIIEGPNQGPD
jgi:hypothetical protein